jgi:ABC-type nitrate/sulfonate/bicarbonate transport system permease component
MIVVMLYILSVSIFALANISLVFLKSKSMKLAINNIIIFSLFPILVFTQDGRKKLQQVLNF